MNRLVRQSLFLFASTLSLAVAPSPAGAQALPPSSWSVAGAGCVPTGQTAGGVGTFNTSGSVGFPEGKSGEIILTCPVPSSVDRVSFLSATHRDSDGSGPTAGVRAALRQKSLVTGGVSDVPGAVVDSNNFPASLVQVRRRKKICFAGNAVPLNHGSFTYYIQVNIRKQGNSAAALSSVDLARIC